MRHQNDRKVLCLAIAVLVPGVGIGCSSSTEGNGDGPPGGTTGSELLQAAFQNQMVVAACLKSIGCETEDPYDSSFSFSILMCVLSGDRYEEFDYYDCLASSADCGEIELCRTKYIKPWKCYRECKGEQLELTCGPEAHLVDCTAFGSTCYSYEDGSGAGCYSPVIEEDCQLVGGVPEDHQEACVDDNTFVRCVDYLGKAGYAVELCGPGTTCQKKDLGGWGCWGDDCLNQGNNPSGGCNGDHVVVCASGVMVSADCAEFGLKCDWNRCVW